MIIRVPRIAQARNADMIADMIPDVIIGREDVQREHTAWIVRRVKSTVWRSGCRIRYQTPEGKTVSILPGFSAAFRRICLTAPQQAFVPGRGQFWRGQEPS